MKTRRQYLGATAVGAAGLLGGCSVLGDGGGSESYPAGVPDPDALDGTPLTHAVRFDLAAIREHSDRFHDDCEAGSIGCSSLHGDIAMISSWVLDLDDVGTLLAGGRHAASAHPRSLASTRGAHAFKVYEYTADGSTVRSALEEEYSLLSSDGSFQYYGQDDDAGTRLADDGNRLVVGLPDVIEVVAERLQGEHDSFAEAVPERAVAREQLGTTSAEVVGQAREPGEDDPDWHDDRTVVAKGVEFGETVTYRSAQVFASEDALSSVSEDDVRAWASEQFEPVAYAGFEGLSTFDVERRDRSLVVTASHDQYVGLY